MNGTSKIIVTFFLMMFLCPLLHAEGSKKSTHHPVGNTDLEDVNPDAVTDRADASAPEPAAAPAKEISEKAEEAEKPTEKPAAVEKTAASKNQADEEEEDSDSKEKKAAAKPAAAKANVPQAKVPESDNTMMYGLVALVVVGGVLFAASKKKVKGKKPSFTSAMPTANGLIETVASCELKRGASLSLVKVGEEYLLLGVTNHQVNLIASLGATEQSSQAPGDTSAEEAASETETSDPEAPKAA